MNLFDEIARYGDLRAKEVGAYETSDGNPWDTRRRADELLDDIRDEFEHNGRSPMPVALVQRMQGLLVQFAGFDLEDRPVPDELLLMWREAQSAKRAIEAWYERTDPEGGA